MKPSESQNRYPNQEKPTIKLEKSKITITDQDDKNVISRFLHDTMADETDRTQKSDREYLFDANSMSNESVDIR